MGIEGFERNLSEESKKALQSETWEMARKAMKTEIVHFTDMPGILDFEAVKVSKNDGVYGIMWGRLVRDYLGTAYSGEAVEAEIVSEGVTYKVLNCGEVTAFYDADGNTLFDVENKRLDREYERLMNRGAGGTAENMDAMKEDEPDRASGMTGDITVRQRAEEKLKKELTAAKDKSFADPIIGYLLERCREDEGLAEDVVQDHKTWQKCFDYIYSQARKQTKGNCAAVCDDVVYEWAEDYYHKDDKAEEAEKARKEAERKEKQKKETAEKAVKTKKKPDNAVTVPEKKEERPREQLKKKSSREMEGQLDMFSLMGM